MVATLNYFGPDREFFETAFFGTGTDLPLSPITMTSSLFVLENTETGAIVDISGTGLAYDSGTDTASGTVTGITFKQAGSTVAQISGISWSFQDMLDALDAINDFDDDSGLNALLSQDDWIVNGATAVGGADFYFDGATSNFTVTGTPFDDVIEGGSGNDDINPLGAGGAGTSDRINGSLGNDIIRFSNTDGQYVGLVYDNMSSAITANINEPANTGTIFGAGFSHTLVDVNRVMDWNTDGFGIDGSFHNDVFNLTGGSETWMRVSGLGGNDTFNINTSGIVRLDYSYNNGMALNIDLAAGTASDGWGGTDTINTAAGMTGRIEVRGTDLADTMVGSDLDERFVGRMGNDTIDGGGGRDGVRYDRPGVGAVDVDLETGVATGTWGGMAFTDTLTSIEEVRGSRTGNDTISGSVGDNWLFGFGGNDLLMGGGGVDYVDGGDGFDTAVFGYNSSQMGVTATANGVRLEMGGFAEFISVERFEFLDRAMNLAQLQALDGQAEINGRLDYFGPDTNFFDTAFFDEFGDIPLVPVSTAPNLIVVQNTVTGAVTRVEGVNLVLDEVNEIFSGTVTGFDFQQGGSSVARMSGITWAFEDFVLALDDISLSGDYTVFNSLMSQQHIQVNGSTATAGLDFALDGDVGSDLYITGTPFGDTIAGELGDDYIDPLGGNGQDTFIEGSLGNDTITFANVDFSYYNLDYSSVGQGVVLEIDNSTNTATVTGAGFTDNLIDINRVMDWAISNGLGFYATGSDDTFTINGGAQTWMQVSGLAGNDTFNIDSADTVRLDYRPASTGVAVNLAAGTAQDGLGGTDTINIAAGMSGRIELRGSDFNDLLIGSAGNDIFIGRLGADTIDGQGGEDRVRYDRNGVDAITVNMGTGTATGTWSGTAFTHQLMNIEEVRGSLGGGDTMIGSANREIFRGMGGNDTFTGGGGDDLIDGGDGNDLAILGFASGQMGVNVTASGILLSYAGSTGFYTAIENFQFSDTTLSRTEVIALDGQTEPGGGEILGTSGNDNLSGTAADDVIRGFAGDDNLHGGPGADTLDGGAGSDTADYVGASARVFVDLINTGSNTNDARGDSYIGIENIRGSLRSDDLRGNNADNLINGSNGDDFIMGRRGNDILIGGNDNDTLIGGDDNDVLSGGDGNDVLNGGAGNDRLVGGVGNDRLIDTAGDNSYVAGGGDDVMFDGRGSSVLFAGSGNDRLIGSGGNDRLLGGTGFDTLNGANGNDTLAGHEGNDYHVGGNGADIFVFQAGMGADRIQDFELGLDRLFIDNALTGGQTDEATVVANFATIVGGNVFFDFGGGNTLEILNLGSTAGLDLDMLIT